MRWIPAALTLALLAPVAWAEEPTPAPPPATGATNGPSNGDDQTLRHMTFMQRFDKANTTHDGHLTLEQAKAGFPYIARNFDKFDADHKGYVTRDDIKAYYEARDKKKEQGQGNSG